MAELSSVQEANEEEDPQRQETINNQTKLKILTLKGSMEG
jgi:hypothetical protein